MGVLLQDVVAICNLFRLSRIQFQNALLFQVLHVLVVLVETIEQVVFIQEAYSFVDRRIDVVILVLERLLKLCHHSWPHYVSLGLQYRVRDFQLFAIHKLGT